MKKMFILILLIILTGCGFKDIVTYENFLTLTYHSVLEDYIPYEEYPTFTLEFDGSLNFTKNRQGEFECIFSQNDDFKVSNIIKNLIKKYQEEGIVSFVLTSTDKANETFMNRRDEIEDKKIYLKVKDGIIRNEICFITLPNGLQLTISYATFQDENNIVYYTWQKTQSIRMILHYPLMACKVDSKRVFLFLALPNQVRLKYDTTTKRFDLLVSDDKFMGSEYYTYDYPNSYSQDYQNFLDYYITNFNGRYINNDFIYTYLGYDFKIEFNQDNFIISKY